MARLLTSGIEANLWPAPVTIGLVTWDPQPTASGAHTQDTSVFRSGVASLKAEDSTSISPAQIYWSSSAGTLERWYYARIYYRFNQAPAAAKIILRFQYTTGLSGAYLQINTSGQLELRNQSATLIGSASSALSVDTWYMVELGQFASATASNDKLDARIDGVSFASTTTDNSITLAPAGLALLEAPETAVDPSFIHWCDDIAVNDDQGANQNTWPGSGKVVLCKPISTNQAGSWTGGAGGAATYDAVDNTPPVGVAAETDTSQIETGDSSGDNATDEFRVNLTTYTTAGIGASDTINVLHPVINDGQEVATGTKTGSFGLQSNPADSYAAFTFCDDVGASGTWPSNWRAHLGTVKYSPSVTLGSSPVLAVRKTDTGTRLAWVDFMGMYVDYTPAAANTPSLIWQPAPPTIFRL